jgi:Cd2+/Zn2+-exporting ATPase
LVQLAYRGLSLLLIACPCALVLSTPAAVAAGLAAGARRGLLVKGGAALETIGRVSVIAFDKTGTLTEGRPHVTDLIALAGTVEETLRLAAAVESSSSHPIAAAIAAETVRRTIAVPAATNAAAIGGKAVTGDVEGRPVIVGSPRYAEELGLFDVKARAAVEALEAAGKTTILVIAGDQVLGARGADSLRSTNPEASRARAVPATTTRSIPVKGRAPVPPWVELLLVLAATGPPPPPPPPVVLGP